MGSQNRRDFLGRRLPSVRAARSSRSRFCGSIMSRVDRAVDHDPRRSRRPPSVRARHAGRRNAASGVPHVRDGRLHDGLREECTFPALRTVGLRARRRPEQGQSADAFAPRKAYQGPGFPLVDGAETFSKTVGHAIFAYRFESRSASISELRSPNPPDRNEHRPGISRSESARKASHSTVGPRKHGSSEKFRSPSVRETSLASGACRRRSSSGQRQSCEISFPDQ